MKSLHIDGFATSMGIRIIPRDRDVDLNGSAILRREAGLHMDLKRPQVRGLDTEVWRISSIVDVPWIVVISVIYFIIRTRRTPGVSVPTAAEGDSANISVGANAGKPRPV
jgi:hypothetical protein